MIKSNSKQQKAEEQAVRAYECKVLKARKFDDGGIVFDLDVNGVVIHGMRYIEYVTKEGKDGSMLSFPSYKKNDKWWTHVWFPISRELQEDIEKQITAGLGE